MSEAGTCGNSACATGGCQTAAKATAKTVKNGKGSSPRSISKKFVNNYGQIRWSHGGKKRREGHKEVVVYS